MMGIYSRAETVPPKKAKLKFLGVEFLLEYFNLQALLHSLSHTLGGNPCRAALAIYPNCKRPKKI